MQVDIPKYFEYAIYQTFEKLNERSLFSNRAVIMYLQNGYFKTSTLMKDFSVVAEVIV